jgi:hypothetical protein
MPAPKPQKPITAAKAIQAINKRGALLVFPLDNRELPPSLWSEFYTDKMRWEWDSNGDDRVASLWQLKTNLSTSREVIYTKWYQGRATVFSKETFIYLLAYFNTAKSDSSVLPKESREILEVLETESPQSTKQIKLAADLKGKVFERIYEQSMKSLFSKLWVVAYGEFEDGAFPSLAVGSSKSLFEDLWDASKVYSFDEAKIWLDEKLGADSLFLKYASKVLHPPLKKQKSAGGIKKKTKGRKKMVLTDEDYAEIEREMKAEAKSINRPAREAHK